MILKMKQLMSQRINANRFLVILIVLSFFSCKTETKEAAIAAVSKSVLGLLEHKDTLMNYDIGLKKLSDYNFFKQPLKNLEPIDENVIVYEMNSPLFTDYASKQRFIALPKGTQINYTSEGVLDFPKGTILIKNFYYQDSELKTENNDVIIETRLLISNKETGEWTALPYIWNEEQTEAYLYILGKDLELDIDIAGQSTRNLKFKYSVPNTNMCKNCHVKDQVLVPLGPTARQLNRNNIFHNSEVNQLSYLNDQEKMVGLETINAAPKIPDYHNQEFSLDQRARAYLDVNCAHCHQEGGSAKTSGLHLSYEETDMYRLGLNKAPVAAGHGSGNLSFGIVAGKPEASILLYRMMHLEPDIVMPEIGKNTLHEEGIKLIEEWINSLSN